MATLIITHPGGAHFDEFFALCLILAHHDHTRFRIERREPTEAELDDPNIWVVDIGLRHEPELKNFDHHQDLSLGASFVLVGDYLGVSEKMSIFHWWSLKDRLDRFGPNNVGKELGIEDFGLIHSPLELWFIDLFAESPLLVQQIMAMFGRSMLDAADRLRERIEFWSTCDTREINGHTILIGLTDESEGSQEFRDRMEKPAVAAITYDSRGEGWRLYRFNDNPIVDFTRISEDPHVKFAHKGGFIAKTHNRIALDQVLDLMARAIVT